MGEGAGFTSSSMGNKFFQEIGQHLWDLCDGGCGD